VPEQCQAAAVLRNLSAAGVIVFPYAVVCRLTENVPASVAFAEVLVAYVVVSGVYGLGQALAPALRRVVPCNLCRCVLQSVPRAPDRLIFRSTF
jgi:hypothetical protein